MKLGEKSFHSNLNVVLLVLKILMLFRLHISRLLLQVEKILVHVNQMEGMEH